MWEGSTLGNTIPRQVVLDCVRNLAAHEPESQGGEQASTQCSSMASDSSSLNRGLRAGNANQVNLFLPELLLIGVFQHSDRNKARTEGSSTVPLVQPPCPPFQASRFSANRTFSKTSQAHRACSHSSVLPVLHSVRLRESLPSPSACFHVYNVELSLSSVQ